MWSRLSTLWRALRGRPEFEDTLADEIRDHIDRYVADLIAAGASPAAARRQARIEFGNVDNVKADCRDARGLRVFDEAHQHLRYALRLLWKAPVFTATSVATLAVCFGACLTIFAVVDAILLRPLPFPNADQLVSIYNTYPRAGVPDDGCSITNYYERRGRLSAFSGLAAYRDGAVIVGQTGQTEREFITRVSPEFFDTLGTSPLLGRAFTDAEMTYETANSAIVSYEYWQEHFGGAASVLGRSIRIDGSPATIVGVLPRSFRFLSSRSRIYLPLASGADERTPDMRHSGNSTRMIARLAAGASVALAQAQIDAHNAVVERTDRQAKLIADAGFRSLVISLHGSHVAAVRPMLLLVQAGVLFLLVIGAVNVTNLLLIRATARLKEFAVRQALGAARRHIVAEVAAETALLTLIGGIAGVALGAAGIRLLVALGSSRLPLGAHLGFDVRVAVAAIAASLATGLAMALPIAWYSVRNYSSSALHAQARGTTASRSAQRLRHAFLITQIALSFVLLAGAGLLATSLMNLSRVAPGFQSAHVLTGQVSLPWARYAKIADRLVFIDRMMDSLHSQPGVVAAGVSTNIPLSGNSNRSASTVKGFVLPPGESIRANYAYAVAGDYFAALRVPIVSGRALTGDDARLGNHVSVVDEDFARRYWPAGNAIGQKLFLGSEEGPDTEAYTVVGVVGAVKQAALSEQDALGAVYYPYAERFDNALYVVTKTSQEPDAFARTLQRVVRGLDPELPVNNIRSMDTRIADSLITRRSPAVLAMLYALIALLLTAIGTYGVLGYAVVQRRREIALRMALGARPDQVRRQFVALAVRLIAGGSIVGIAGAWMTGRAMQALLFQVPPLPASIVVLTAAVLATVCLAACMLPSWRAARIAPSSALAEE